MSQDARDQLGRLIPLILLIIGATVLLVIGSLMVAGGRGEDVKILVLDVYELTGTRTAGLLTIIGVALLAITSAICVFSARITWTFGGTERWGPYLLGAGLLTLVLALDDYLAVHELSDELLMLVTGTEAGRILGRVMELMALAVYGLLFAVLLWRFGSTVSRTEWVLLVVTGAFLLASLALDVAPHSPLADTFGVSFEAQAVLEDALKLIGIVMYATYFVRTSAKAVRAMPG